MDRYTAVQDACPDCGGVIGDRGVAAIDNWRDGQVRYVEVECKCGYAWREILDPHDAIEISTDDHALDDFA